MMTERKRINEVFPDWLTGGGIFSALQELDVPWKDENIADSLDLIYHGQHSGGKLISPLIQRVMNGDVLTSTEINTLATAIFKIRGNSWARLYNTLGYEYNPIENYSMTETMTDDETVIEYGKTHTRTDNLSHTKTGTETDTPNTTDTETPNTTNTTEDNVFGFNSSEAVPTGGNTVSATGTNTITHTGTDTTTYNTTDSDTGTQTEADTGNDTHTRNYTLTRSGNIGVTTSQQMIESERSLWLWNFFIDVVYPDVDKYLTLAIY